MNTELALQLYVRLATAEFAICEARKLFPLGELPELDQAWGLVCGVMDRAQPEALRGSLATLSRQRKVIPAAPAPTARPLRPATTRD